MTFVQIAAILIVASMLILFMWDRWRYDMVALGALLAAIVTGVVPADRAFSGFSHPVIVIIASVLIISRAIARSGVLDRAVLGLMARTHSISLQVGLLTAAVSFLSAFVKNVGTLGIFMPLAIQIARRGGRSPSLYLMPLAFGSLIGGTMTLIGTSPNLLASVIREKETGVPYQMFDFAAVGLPLTLIAVIFLAFGWRLLPMRLRDLNAAADPVDTARYMTELRVTAGSPLDGATVADLEQQGRGDLVVTSIIREGNHHYIPSRTWRIYAGDVIMVHGAPETIQAATVESGVEIVAAVNPSATAPSDEGALETVEAIVAPDSLLIGQTAKSLRLREHYEANLLAVSRAGHRVSHRLHSHRFDVGDIVLIQALGPALAGLQRELGVLPLAGRNNVIGRRGGSWVPVLVLLGAVGLMLTGHVPPAIGFFGAAVLLIAMRQIGLRAAYGALEGPVIVMLAALIPVGEALKDTGVADILAGQMAAAAILVPGQVAVGIVLLTSMLLTPLLHHAPAVLVLGPIAATIGRQLGYSIDPFLMAVALGAACDFLTPIGHQNNLLVMSPGGYRFGDYWRLGLPLTLLVLLAGTPLILYHWPL